MELLYSNMLCVSVQPCTLAVHAYIVLPFQKATVSPYHCGTSWACLRPIRKRRIRLPAVPDRNCTWYGFIMTSNTPLGPGCDHHRISPSG